MVQVGWFLAAYGERSGERPAKPPRELSADSWATAYAMFYEKLGGGRTLGSFSNSLKNARDAFDSWLGLSGRVGWREEDGPRSPLSLTKQNRETDSKFKSMSREDVWNIVSPFADLSIAEVPVSVFRTIETIEASEADQNREILLEGGSKAYVSTRIERNPKARADAIRIHGTRCQVCSFDFEKVYGTLGQGYIEVHHVSPIAESGRERRTVEPAVDLAVVCANCHRMIHRKRDKLIPIERLRQQLAAI